MSSPRRRGSILPAFTGYRRRLWKLLPVVVMGPRFRGDDAGSYLGISAQ
jgi:hypothetical protein